MLKALSAGAAVMSVGAALALAAPASSHTRASAAASRCNVGSGQGYGYSYLTSLSVSGVSCGTGRAVAKKHGRVRGWSCHQKRLDTSPVQYDERVSCTSGHASIAWTFTQNT